MSKPNATDSKTLRRTLLKSIGYIGLGGTGLSLGLPHHAAHTAHAQADVPPLPERWQGQPLGRITGEYMNARAEPSTDADISAVLYQNDVVRVRRLVRGQTVWLHNDLWLETQFGYLYSSFVQPMWYHLPQPPLADLGIGRWAEVIAPFTDAYWEPDSRDEARLVDRLHYGAVFRVVGLAAGQDGRQWYRVKELYQSFYIRAAHLRLIPDEDLAPITPDIPVSDKYIVVNLTEQTLVAYERETPVFAHYVSSGLPDHPTPDGIHYIFDKRPGERMVGGTAASDDDSERYNLAGVPFVCYFTGNWVATHGCYWHNDYGQQRSHGCVNLPPYAARWIWRWTHPIVPLDKLFVQTETPTQGTRVVVRY